MSVRCPRCDEVIPEKIFKEIQEWGPDAMRCNYCDCPLNKSIYTQRQWDRIFGLEDQEEVETMSQLVARKSKQVARQFKKSADSVRKDYLF